MEDFPTGIAYYSGVEGGKPEMSERYAPSVKRIPELDGVRVILVFLVSWYHIWQQSWLTPSIGRFSLDFLVRAGYVPVDGTILLSAFLLFLPYARTMVLDEPLPDARTFYERRFMRIVPSYYAVTLLTLFAIALPWGLYASTAEMAQDVAAHLTFTLTFFRSTYLYTKLGAVSWTLIIEAQAYLLFPLIGRLARKNLAGVAGFMTALAWMFRGLCLWKLSQYDMVVNQLPNFLDVYAIGMIAALAYVRLTQAWKRVKRPLLWEALATVVLVLCVWGLTRALRAQAREPSHDLLQAGQMMRRTLFALLLAPVLVALPFTVKPLRLLLGNRVTAFLSAISMNYYLTHQTIAVHLKRLGIPPSVSELPNQAGERAWQWPYTWLCFGLSVLAAILLTFLVEKPAAKGLKRLFARLHRARKKGGSAARPETP